MRDIFYFCATKNDESKIAFRGEFFEIFSIAPNLTSVFLVQKPSQSACWNAKHKFYLGIIRIVRNGWASENFNIFLIQRLSGLFAVRFSLFSF